MRSNNNDIRFLHYFFCFFFLNVQCSMPSLWLLWFTFKWKLFRFPRAFERYLHQKIYCSSDLKWFLLFQDRIWRMKSKPEPEPVHRTDDGKKWKRRKKEKKKTNLIVRMWQNIWIFYDWNEKTLKHSPLVSELIVSSIYVWIRIQRFAQ